MSTVIDTRTWLASVDGRHYRLVPIREYDAIVGYVVCHPDSGDEVGHFYVSGSEHVHADIGFLHDVTRLRGAMRAEDRHTLPDARSGAYWTRELN